MMHDEKMFLLELAMWSSVIGFTVILLVTSAHAEAHNFLAGLA